MVRGERIHFLPDRSHRLPKQTDMRDLKPSARDSNPPFGEPEPYMRPGPRLPTTPVRGSAGLSPTRVTLAALTWAPVQEINGSAINAASPSVSHDQTTRISARAAKDGERELIFRLLLHFAVPRIG